MRNLKRIIGPAPSELPITEFIFSRLGPERQRVEYNLELFRAGKIPSWNKKKTAKKKAAKRVTKKAKVAAAMELEKMMAEDNMTFDDLKKLLED